MMQKVIFNFFFLWWEMKKLVLQKKGNKVFNAFFIPLDYTFLWKKKTKQKMQCDSIWSARGFAVPCFASAYNDNYVVAHDHLIGRLARLVSAFDTSVLVACRSESRSLRTHAHIWHQVARTHCRTHARTLTPLWELQMLWHLKVANKVAGNIVDGHLQLQEEDVIHQVTRYLRQGS